MKRRQSNTKGSEARLQSQIAGSAPLLKQMHYKRKSPDALENTQMTQKPSNNEKTNSKVDVNNPHESLKIPRSFVVKHGKVNRNLKDLVKDLRKLMSPYTALNLRDSAKASVKDYIAVSGHLKVSYMMVVSETDKSPILKIARLPSNGPTLTFKIEKYCLDNVIRQRQLASRRRANIDHSKAFEVPPLVVLNNFDGLSQTDLNKTEESMIKVSTEADLQDLALNKATAICALTFQNMFPKINVDKTEVKDCQRILLFNYDKNNNTIEMRHYHIKIKQKGVSKMLKKIIRAKDAEFGDVKDIADLLDPNSKVDKNLFNYATSDSEFEGVGDNEVQISRKKGSSASITGLGSIKNALDRKIVKNVNEIKEKISKNARRNSSDNEEAENESDNDAKSQGTSSTRPTSRDVNAVQLVEIGPRLNLKLVKIEEGLFKGEVKYHSFVAKTKEEIKKLRVTAGERQEEKRKRKEIQDENVEKKRQKVEGKAEKKKARKERLKARLAAEEGTEGATKNESADDEDDQDEDEDESD